MSWVGQKAVSTLWPPHMNSGTESRAVQSLLAVRRSMIPPRSSSSITSIEPSPVWLAEHRSSFDASPRAFAVSQSTLEERSSEPRCAGNRATKQKLFASRAGGSPRSWPKAHPIPAVLLTSISLLPLHGASCQRMSRLPFAFFRVPRTPWSQRNGLNCSPGEHQMHLSPCTPMRGTSSLSRVDKTCLSGSLV